jgi:replicative DNA helicase
MNDKESPASEAEELDSFLRKLESGGAVKEIAGWETGFASLDRALNGISPGLYLLIGPPACGKSAFAKQLLDQVVRQNSVPGLFFVFAEKKNDVRIRTLARLSGLEMHDIRRGAGYLLHAYGAPKRQSDDPEQLPARWEKLRATAEQAKNWLDMVYLFECNEATTLNYVEQRISEVGELKKSKRPMVMIDDCQRLGAISTALDTRLPPVVEKLQDLRIRLDLPIFAIWPDLKPAEAPQLWAEKTAGADVIMVMREDAERSKQLSEPNRAIALHIVKNRAGEKATLRFDFSPPLAKFIEHDSHA